MSRRRKAQQRQPARIIPCEGEHGGYVVHPDDRVVRTLPTERDDEHENPLDVPAKPKQPSAATDLLDVPGAPPPAPEAAR